MRRRGDRKPISLDELRDRLTETDLIPSQEPLRDELVDRFALLHKAGVPNVADLRRQLKTPKSLGALAEASGVEAGYLGRLKRALGGFFPKPRALGNFTWLDPKVISALAAGGIKNTVQFNQAAKNGVARLEQEHGLTEGSLDELAALADLSRVQWVSPNFAGALVAAGYRTSTALAAADPQTLHDAVAAANEDRGFYQGVVGQRDISRVVHASRYVDWT